MLILLRKVGEDIVIDRRIIVSVARVTRNRVYLTIEAPANVRVDRQEIRLAKNRELRAAALRGAAESQTGAGETNGSRG
jgi:carbon storage regulator CsrA